MFQESQSVAPQLLTYLVVSINLILCAYFGYLFLSPLLNEAPSLNANIPSWLAVLLCGLFAGVAYFLSHLRIQTKVTDKNLLLSMGFLGKRKIPLASIASVEAFKGRLVTGAMNLGYHLSANQTGYMGQAHDAVLIKFKNNDELVLTTEHSNELKAALLH